MDLSWFSGLFGVLGIEPSLATFFVFGAGILFFLSLLVCVVAVRASHRASTILSESRTILSETRDASIEIRHLAAQAERASLRINETNSSASLSERIQSVRVDENASANADGNDATDFVSADTTDAETTVSHDGDNTAEDEALLEKAAKAASEPSALLRSILRRR